VRFQVAECNSMFASLDSLWSLLGKNLLLGDFPCFVRPARSRLEEKSKLVARRGNVIESSDVAVALQIDIVPSVACHAG